MIYFRNHGDARRDIVNYNNLAEVEGLQRLDLWCELVKMKFKITEVRVEGGGHSYSYFLTAFEEESGRLYYEIGVRLHQNQMERCLELYN